jgi:endonuclease/exonuclease/phosphatase family metal-dependent hydrolase
MAEAEAPSVRVLSWNVDSVVYAPSWSHAAKARTCVALAREHACSLLALQEVAESGQLPALRAAFATALPAWRVVAAATGPPWRARGPNGFEGAPVQEVHAFAYDSAVVTLLEPPRAFLQGDAAAFKRPPVLAEFMLRGGVRLTLCSVHLRAEDGEARAEAAAFGALVLPALRDELGERLRSVVLCGDFNLAPPVAVGGLRLAPDPGAAFARIRAAGFRHLNERATNLAAIAAEERVFDNFWVSPQMCRLLLPSAADARLSTVVCADESAVRAWRAASGHAPDGEATREQTALFAAALWADHCAAKGGPPGAPLPARKQPTKWFSHARGWSDHRPLFIELRTGEGAAAVLATPPALLPRSPVAADLEAHAQAMRALRDQLAAASLGGELAPELSSLADKLCDHAAAAAAATRGLADEAAAAAAVDAPGGEGGAVPGEPGGKLQCCGRTQKNACCSITKNLTELPPGGGVFWCRAFHIKQGEAAAAALAAALPQG